MLTDFYFFYCRILTKFATKSMSYISPHFKDVTPLPCKTQAAQFFETRCRSQCMHMFRDTSNSFWLQLCWLHVLGKLFPLGPCPLYKIIQHTHDHIAVRTTLRILILCMRRSSVKARDLRRNERRRYISRNYTLCLKNMVPNFCNNIINC